MVLFIGFATNGEWNSLRENGNTRPLSIFEIRKRVRNQYGKLKESTLLKMLTPKCKSCSLIACNVRIFVFRQSAWFTLLSTSLKYL